MRSSIIDNEEELKTFLIDCRNNDLSAQSRLYSSYYYLVYNSCKKYVKIDSELEDITQEAFIKIISKIDKFEGKSPAQFVNWVKMVSKNSTIDILKYRKNNIEINEEYFDSNLNTIDLDAIDDIDGKMVNDVKNAINKLSPPLRKIIELYYLDDYTHEEIANKLNIHIGTSKSNLFKAKKKLAVLLNQYNNRINN